MPIVPLAPSKRTRKQAFGPEPEMGNRVTEFGMQTGLEGFSLATLRTPKKRKFHVTVFLLDKA